MRNLAGDQAAVGAIIGRPVTLRIIILADETDLGAVAKAAILILATGI
jgi:hypothetical protein